MQGADEQREWLRPDTEAVRVSEFEWVLGADGKARRVESSFRCLVNGVWCGLAGLRAGLVHQASKEVRRHAKESSRSTREILSLVQNVYEQEALQRAIGVRGEFLQAEVLFGFLRDLASACGQPPDHSRFEKAHGFDEKGAMRSVRIADIDFGSSCRRQPDGQYQTQFADPVLALSFVLACHAAAHWQVAERAHAKALPLLAHGEVARVAKLRAFGNAIDPRPAAAFIRAALNLS